ncbi:hypothetical protein SRHO_G00048130 [Serrasalmus rhombeus]
MLGCLYFNTKKGHHYISCMFYPQTFRPSRHPIKGNRLVGVKQGIGFTSSDDPGFFLSSSHLRNLQIWCPVLRFRQLLQTPQLMSLLQGAHTPHLFLFFLAGFPSGRGGGGIILRAVCQIGNLKRTVCNGGGGSGGVKGCHDDDPGR